MCFVPEVVPCPYAPWLQEPGRGFWGKPGAGLEAAPLFPLVSSLTGHTWTGSLTRDPAVSVGFACFSLFVCLFFFCFGTVTELASWASLAALLLGSPEPVCACQDVGLPSLPTRGCSHPLHSPASGTSQCQGQNPEKPVPILRSRPRLPLPNLAVLLPLLRVCATL